MDLNGDDQLWTRVDDTDGSTWQAHIKIGEDGTVVMSDELVFLLMVDAGWVRTS